MVTPKKRLFLTLIKERRVTDLVIVLVVSVIFWIVLAEFEAFEWFFEYSRSHEDWDLDELILFVVAIPLPMLWYTIRRSMDVADQSKKRLEIERELSHMRKVESLGTMAGGMAHELNNQLQPVIALAEMTVSSMDDDDANKRRFELILAGALRARGTVNQILQFSRRNQEATETQGGPASVKGLIEFLSITCPSSIHLDVDIKDDFEKIAMPWEDVETVVVNLFSNAIAAMEGHQGTIYVSAAKTNDGNGSGGDSVTIIVEDQGMGIAEKDKNRIFEPFFTTKEVGKGTGLGMWQVQTLVQDAGGEIGFDSTVNVGTRFQVRLPTADQAND